MAPGDQIVAGGRYDKLLGQFGKEAAAVGFAVYMDSDSFSLTTAIKTKTMITHMKSLFMILNLEAALSLTNALRDQGVKTELISKEERYIIRGI